MGNVVAAKEGTATHQTIRSNDRGSLYFECCLVPISLSKLPTTSSSISELQFQVGEGRGCPKRCNHSNAPRSTRSLGGKRARAKGLQAFLHGAESSEPG